MFVCDYSSSGTDDGGAEGISRIRGLTPGEKKVKHAPATRAERTESAISFIYPRTSVSKYSVA
jgi:hypothetical protein